MQAIGASEKVFEYIDRKPEIAHDDGVLAPDRLSGRIAFKNVYFSYPGRPNAVVLKVILVFRFFFIKLITSMFAIKLKMKLKCMLPVTRRNAKKDASVLELLN